MSSASFINDGGQQQRPSAAGPIRVADTAARSNLLASRQISVQPIVIKPAHQLQGNHSAANLTVVRSMSAAGGDSSPSPRLSPTMQMSMNDYKNLLSANASSSSSVGSSASSATSRSSASPVSSPLPQASASSVDILTLLAPPPPPSTSTPPPPTITVSSPTETTQQAARLGPNAQTAVSRPVIRSESLPVNQQHPLQRADSLAQPSLMQPGAGVVRSSGDLLSNGGDCSKKFFEVGKYILFDSNVVNNDTLNTAYNSENHNFYTWKKFTKQDYKKKLEPYFIMEGCSEHVYKISEIILNHVSVDQNAVYVMFDTYYGDLHTYMKEKKRLGEPEARHIFRQCVKAVQQCHENGIIVRDIKLKKFIFTNPERTNIALTNLEDCLVLDEDAPNDLIRSQQGCPAYVSPEVLNSQQTPYSGMLSDSWSLGIVLFTLLFGRYPFHHQVITSMFARIARAKFQIPPSSGLTADAKMLLRSLIRLKPSERLRPFEILAHNWFKQVDDEFNFNLNQAQTSSTVVKQNMVMNMEPKFVAPAAVATWLTAPNSSTTTPVNPAAAAFNAHKPLGMSLSAPNRLLNEAAARRSQLRRTATASRPPFEENDDDNDCLVPVFESATETASHN